MNNILEKFKKIAGMGEEEYDYIEQAYENGRYVDYPPTEVSEVEERENQSDREVQRYSNTRQGSKMSSTKSNVIGMPGLANNNSEVVVIEPHSFDEMPQVIQALRERRSVVLNLHTIPEQEAQRAVDFVAGGTYAMDGSYKRVGERIFLFAPSCVKVSTALGTERDISEIAEERVRRSVLNRPAMTNPDFWNQEQTAVAQ